jgi:hypothetical protein
MAVLGLLFNVDHLCLLAPHMTMEVLLDGCLG